MPETCVREKPEPRPARFMTAPRSKCVHVSTNAAEPERPQYPITAACRIHASRTVCDCFHICYWGCMPLLYYLTDSICPKPPPPHPAVTLVAQLAGGMMPSLLGMHTPHMAPTPQEIRM